MATTTFLDKQQKGLLKKYHTLCAKLGKSESEKREIVAAYGAASSRELTAYDLMDICDKLDAEITPKLADYDKWRKRVIAAIFAWRKAARGVKVEKREDAKVEDRDEMAMIKAIACRAAKYDSFNAIPLERLRSLYGAFVNKRKDLQFVGELTVEELEYMALVN